MNPLLLLIGAALVALGLSSVSQNNGSIWPSEDGVEPALLPPPSDSGSDPYYNPSLNDPGMGGLTETAGAGFGALGAVYNWLTAGRRIRCRFPVTMGWTGQSSGNLNTLRSLLSQSFTVLRVYTASGPSLIIEIQLRRRWTGGAHLMFFLIDCARQAGFVEGSGSGSFGLMR